MTTPTTHTDLINQAVVTAVTSAVSVRSADVSSRISALVISDNDSYRAGDLLLVEIRQARKMAEEIFAEKIRTPILEPARKALDGLYALERELTKTPFDAFEKSLKAKMADWQDRERRRINDEQLARRREELRIAKEAEEARRIADEAEHQAALSRQAAEFEAQRAKTKAQREEALKKAKVAEETRLAAEKNRVEAQAAAYRAEEARQAAITAEAQKTVKGVGSKVIVKRVPVVTDMAAFLKAVIAGAVPEICVMVNEDVLMEYWKQDAGIVSSWPGVKVEERVSVGGR